MNCEKMLNVCLMIWLSCLKIRKEIGRCYELIHRLGRGVVYLGSSRMGPDHPHYSQALELGREVISILVLLVVFLYIFIEHTLTCIIIGLKHFQETPWMKFP